MRASDTVDLESVALPPPSVSAFPPDVLAGREVALRVRRHIAMRGGYRLELEPETGRAMLVEYRLAKGVRLPVEVGETLRWRLPLDSRQESVGLVVREGDGALRALVVVGRDTSALAGEIGALGIAPDFSSGSLVYGESVAVMSCLIHLDHHALRLSDGREVRWARPGTTQTVELVETRGSPRITLSGAADEEDEAVRFELLVLDVSRASHGAEDSRCPGRDHVSWALLRSASR